MNIKDYSFSSDPNDILRIAKAFISSLDIDDILTIISVVIFSLIFFGIIIATIIVNRNDKRKKALTKYVETNSIALKKLSELNQEFGFYNIDDNFTYVKSCNSTATYRFANIEKFVLEIIQDNIYFFKSQISRANSNKSMYDNYCSKVLPLLNMISANNWQTLSKKEQLLCEKLEKEAFTQLMLTPTTQVKIRIIKEYTSPMGQNHYEEEFNYSQNDILDLIKKAEEIKKHRKTSQYQRSLLTPSMRYDIMQRDNFKCVICGASVSDGASLEVDHIVPIAKGGKTEPNNLRTLCHTCNAGKSDKYDADGIN